MAKIDSENFIANRRDYDTSYTATFSEPTLPGGLVVITPTAGHRLQVVNVFLNTAATTGNVRLRFATTPKTVTKFYMASGTQTQYEWQGFVLGAKDEALTLTATTPVDTEYNLTINYKQYPN